jgi:hypothetical protein
MYSYKYLYCNGIHKERRKLFPAYFSHNQHICTYNKVEIGRLAAHYGQAEKDANGSKKKP